MCVSVVSEYFGGWCQECSGTCDVAVKTTLVTIEGVLRLNYQDLGLHTQETEREDAV